MKKKIESNSPEGRRLLWLKILFVLSVLSLWLPWFTFNANMMGYRYGIMFWPWFVQYIVLVGAALFSNSVGRRPVAGWVAAVSALLNLCAVVAAAGKWMERANIDGGFHLRTGLRGAQVGYWISAALFLGVFLLLVSHLRKTRSEQN